VSTTNRNWEDLQTALRHQSFLSLENPVIISLKNGNMIPAQGLGAIQQYYYLVMTIVQFLAIAMARIPVASAKTELLRNLGEELGSKTSGTSHQELFARLAQKELGISIRAPWNEATQNFICNLLWAFNNYTSRQVAGMIYALEATASPELIMVAEVINLSARRTVVDLGKLTAPAREEENYQVQTLEGFIASHTCQFEIGHESGLRSTLEKFASADWQEFEYGFYQVLAWMQIWWKGLARS